MPNSDVMERWANALESGEYPQTKGALHRFEEYALDEDEKPLPVGFCCLGVLCVEAQKAGVDVPVKAAAFEKGLNAYGGQTSFPPLSVTEWAGLWEHDPRVKVCCGECDNGRHDDGADCDMCNGRGHFYDTLSALNDDHRLDFPAIAKVIRENFIKEKGNANG